MLNREIVFEKAKEILEGCQSHSRREPGWPFRHGYRTANVALWLRQRILPEDAWMDDILYAAGLFHDCAKDDEEDHASAGAVRAGEYLQGLVSREDLPVICRVIERHNKRGQESTALEQILQDADIIDHFGTIEVWLNVSYSVLGGEGPERSLKFYETEWEPMIDELRGLLNFELSKRVFEDRIAFDEAFIKRLRVEAVGGVVEV